VSGSGEIGSGAVERYLMCMVAHDWAGSATAARRG